MHSYSREQCLADLILLVLILVLMEDALVLPMVEDEEIEDVGLNPCFNGRCTRTKI